eukprot:6213048-Pleurochrysis_carterae.AAC.2
MQFVETAESGLIQTPDLKSSHLCFNCGGDSLEAALNLATRIRINSRPLTLFAARATLRTVFMSCLSTLPMCSEDTTNCAHSESVRALGGADTEGN